MTDHSPADLARRYTRRAFSVLRVAGGLADAADRDVARLGRELIALIAGADVGELGRRDLAALLRDIDARIATAFGTLGASQVEAVREVLRIEAAWAAGTLVGSPPAESTLARIARDFLALGAKPADLWSRSGDTLASRIADAVREAHALGTPVADVRARLGEIVATARRDAQSIADVSTTSAANAGHSEAARENGAVAYRWHAVLDARTTTGCAVRHGLLYTLELEPIGHSVPIERPPPRHYGCRSLLVTLGRMPRPTDRPVGSFEEFIAGMSIDEQNDVLGKGRAELWRRGVLTKADLVNQRGRVLTLAELRARPD